MLTTAGSDEQARALACALVEERLAACVNVVPRVVSVYRWKGSVEEEDERLLVVKTAARLFERVRERIRELHAYELPEVVRIPIEGGDPEYLAWIGASVAPEES